MLNLDVSPLKTQILLKWINFKPDHLVQYSNLRRLPWPAPLPPPFLMRLLQGSGHITWPNRFGRQIEVESLPVKQKFYVYWIKSQYCARFITNWVVFPLFVCRAWKCLPWQFYHSLYFYLFWYLQLCLYMNFLAFAELDNVCHRPHCRLPPPLLGCPQKHQACHSSGFEFVF